MSKSTIPLVLSSKDIERFWSKVNKDGPIPVHCPELGRCWPWTASCLPTGYGRFGVGSRRDGSRRLVVTSRVAWELENGPLPDGHHACHHCDNPPCCNPAHIFPGTDTDNARDKMAKGRGGHRRGERISWSILTEENVLEIRRRYVHGGITYPMLAHEYGVSVGAINKVINRRSWKHLLEDI